jgi:CHC2 zinc finger/RepB DNA-primase from phage plasmid
VSAQREHRTGELLAYLGMLAGAPASGQFFDVRWARAKGPMRRRFVSALCVEDTARLIVRLARRGDVYVGVALREGSTHGGKSAIGGSHLLYVECDDPHASDRLTSFAHPPSMEVASGTPGHLQLYWRLHQRAASSQVESANRRLAVRLGGDPAAVDIARVLRPPETFNYKHDPPLGVVLLACRAGAPYTLAQLTKGLPEDPHPRAPERARMLSPRAARTRLDRELLAIPGAEYVRVLTNRSPNQAGKVLCPFHAESDPSLQLYPDGTFYCFGSGCRRGGSIIDFAAHLWGMTPRDEEFIELRRRLTERFGLSGARRS